MQHPFLSGATGCDHTTQQPATVQMLRTASTVAYLTAGPQAAEKPAGEAVMPAEKHDNRASFRINQP